MVRSFAEAYNARRHEGEGKITLPVPPKPRSAEARRMQIASKRSQGEAFPSGRDEYSYTLIRSDLEEDRWGHELPQMPRHELGMRQRTRQIYGHLHHPEQDELATSSLAWVDSGVFQGISGIVICFNAILIGLETDLDLIIWFYVDQMLLCFFTFELTARLLRHRLYFFQSEEDGMWNVFDFTIVCSGVFDQWMCPLLMRFGVFGSGDDGEHGHHHKSRGGGTSVYFLLMRMLRLLRIVRLFRLVKIVRPLYELAQGVLEALQGMFWVLVFLVMTLYTVAILCTRLIGKGDILSEEMQAVPAIQDIVAMFTSVEDSMFTLFGALSSWSLLKFVPLFAQMPILKPMFVVFYVYSAWALLAVMTGVVSENMIAIREQMVKEDEAKEELRRTMVSQTLVELFRGVDADQSGTISREEFNLMLGSPDLIRKIERNTHLKIQDLLDLYDWLDRDGSGHISHEEFMKGFTFVNEPLRAKSLVKLQECIVQDLRSLELHVTETLETRVEEVEKLIAAPLRKVHAITEQMQTLDMLFATMRTNMRDPTTSMPSREEVRGVEHRLTAKMSKILKRLKEVERAAHAPPG